MNIEGAITNLFTPPDTAYTIKVKHRFFCGFGKSSRVKTAWCLAGAKFYQKESLETDLVKLEKLNKNPTVHAVCVTT
ncbi:MAG TPA: hypothetical protein ENH88_05095 [Pseudoalteromonas prydzensis]|uniref:Uncharacterized protein n=1 Tax=Pseudoalteromonas prydzensis TaxID=182141 RepID=A0A7V1CWV7_9GAMM|nr:hypothetical protein [Pseudoalteromonas prydzensis]HEA15821.1 hypothetical protein [Pseudoalteromonas prydzensis]